MQPSHRAAFCFPAAFCLFLKTTFFRKLRRHFAFPGHTLQEQLSAVTSVSALFCARVDDGGATRPGEFRRNLIPGALLGSGCCQNHISFLLYSVGICQNTQFHDFHLPLILWNWVLKCSPALCLQSKAMALTGMFLKPLLRAD